MFKFTLYIIALFLCLGEAFAQGGETTLDNTGGQLINTGIIRVRNGQVKALPDTVGGRVEFSSEHTTAVTKIPNIVFNQLIFSGLNIKYIDTTNSSKPLVARDSFVVESSAELQVHIVGADAQKTFKNASRIKGANDIRLINESAAQNLVGTGNVDQLNIDNPNGVDVVNNGQTINKKLTLKRGQLRNSAPKNVTMADSATIIRYPQGSIAFAPDLAGVVNLEYTGAGSIRTGPEVPNNKNKIKDFTAKNSDTLRLAKSLQVNKKLNIATRVFTDSNAITHANASRINYDPSKPDAQIDGTLRKSIFVATDTILLNNPYTYVKLDTGGTRSKTREIQMTMRTKTYPPTSDGNEKTERYADLKLLNAAGNPLYYSDSLQFTLGFGWRYAPSLTFDETHDLINDLNELLLQRYVTPDWLDYSSQPVKLDTINHWASIATDFVNSSGLFSVGLPAPTGIVFRGKALLEGPYVQNTFGIMRSDLQQKGYLANLPSKAVYPYNLDPNYDPNKIKTLPDSIVDFVVMEFRRERNSEAKFFKTVIMRYDGALLDLEGKDLIRLTRKDGLDSGGGEYYVALRHRNHSTIITENPLSLIPENNSKLYDFTDPAIIEGRISALKLVYYLNGSRVYAMRAGYNANDPDTMSGLINAQNYATELPDQILPWNEVGREGYLLGDYNLDGIINTRDFNISWNNRKK
ncbi:MAG: hypothetical protein ACM3U1_11360 [Chloroflexota bacterium]